jgi:hypothetical protein
MQFQSANGLHKRSFNRDEGNTTSPWWPGVPTPLVDARGSVGFLGIPTMWKWSPETCALCARGLGLSGGLLVGGEEQVLAAVWIISCCMYPGRQLPPGRTL